MINANELRIGNLVDHYFSDDTDDSVTDRMYEHIEAKDISDDEYLSSCYPIPLTPEILEKAGFEYDGATTLSRDDSPLYFKILAGKGSAFVEKLHQPFEVHCEFVHQLQNLYFALTGEELTINL